MYAYVYVYKLQNSGVVAYVCLKKDIWLDFALLSQHTDAYYQTQG